MVNAPQKEDSVSSNTPVVDSGPVPRETVRNEKASRFVKYTGGRGSHREVTRSQWKEVGINQDSVVFGPLNGLMVAVGTKNGLSSDAVERLLNEKDEFGRNEFELVDSEGKPVSE